MRFNLIENYIYIYQLNKYLIIPTYPEQINDSLGSTFNETQALSRTAPVYAYANSGPRQIQFTFDLHRDMMDQFNRGNRAFTESNLLEMGDDYIDALVRYLQAMALPSYKIGQVQSAINTGKLVNPPEVAVRFGNTLFIKGIVKGDVGVVYSGPIARDNKYQMIQVTFTVVETEPQDANTLSKWGSMRGLEAVMTRGLYKSA